MSSQPPSQPTRRVSVSEQRAKRQQGKPNRSQVRAAQTRAAQQAAAPATTAVVQEVVPETGKTETVVRTRRLTQAQRRAIERGGVARGSGLPTGVVPLSRGEEMAMVREDMNRLLVIAGILLVGMIALLLILD